MNGIVTVKCESCDEYIMVGSRWCRTCIEKQIEEEQMNGDDIEHWGQDHFEKMALFRTVAAGVNIFLSHLLIAKVWGVI